MESKVKRCFEVFWCVFLYQDKINSTCIIASVIWQSAKFDKIKGLVNVKLSELFFLLPKANSRILLEFARSLCSSWFLSIWVSGFLGLFFFLFFPPPYKKVLSFGWFWLRKSCFSVLIHSQKNVQSCLWISYQGTFDV